VEVEAGAADAVEVVEEGVGSKRRRVYVLDAIELWLGTAVCGDWGGEYWHGESPA
jgi:hypothetical protein